MTGQLTLGKTTSHDLERKCVDALGRKVDLGEDIVVAVGLVGDEEFPVVGLVLDVPTKDDRALSET